MTTIDSARTGDHAHHFVIDGSSPLHQVVSATAIRPTERTPLSQSPPVEWFASGTFWAIAAVVVAVVAIAVGVWAAFRSANPRRNLHITVDSSVSLLHSAPGLGDDVEVHRRGQVLSKPHVVTVSVVSRSARDIPRAAFDGTPLTLDFGVPVIGLLEQRSDPGRAAVSAPSIKMTATTLAIGPALLTRNHELRYTVLVDGKPNLATQGELADVHINTKPPRPRMTTNRIVSTIARIVTYLLGVTAITWPDLFSLIPTVAVVAIMAAAVVASLLPVLPGKGRFRRVSGDSGIPNQTIGQPLEVGETSPVEPRVETPRQNSAAVAMTTVPVRSNALAQSGVSRHTGSTTALQRSLLVCCDLQSYGSADDLLGRELQELLVRSLDRAGEAAGLDRSTWRWQAKGDEEWAVLPATMPEGDVVDRYVRALDAELSSTNRYRVPEAKLRLRMAIHFGTTVEGANGYPGQDAVLVSRLLNSEPAHAALEQSPNSDLVVVLSDTLFTSLVAARFTTLRPEDFRRVDVRMKTFRGHGWMWIPRGEVHGLVLDR